MESNLDRIRSKSRQALDEGAITRFVVRTAGKMVLNRSRRKAIAHAVGAIGRTGAKAGKYVGTKVADLASMATKNMKPGLRNKIVKAGIRQIPKAGETVGKQVAVRGSIAGATAGTVLAREEYKKQKATYQKRKADKAAAEKAAADKAAIKPPVKKRRRRKKPATKPKPRLTKPKSPNATKKPSTKKPSTKKPEVKTFRDSGQEWDVAKPARRTTVKEGVGLAYVGALTGVALKSVANAVAPTTTKTIGTALERAERIRKAQAAKAKRKSKTTKQ